MPDPSFEKYFPPHFELETPRVLLRPLRAGDIDTFHSLTQSCETWRFFTRDLSDPAELKIWVDEALLDMQEGKRMPMTVIDKDTKEICGSSSFGNLSFYDKRLEIGWSWLGPEYIGMGVNKHVKFSMISYSFEVMRMERVEAKTDMLNERAKAGLLKVGMIPEGVLRSHMQMHSDRRRDTIYFSILRNEWPERRATFFPELL